MAIEKKCLQCGKMFSVGNYRKDTAKFCSYKCGGKYRYENDSKVRRCFTYDKSGDKHPMWNGGITKNSQGYVLIYSPDHPKRDSANRVREHRLIMEKQIGRYLEDYEVVHHKNGIKDDNRIENLELTTKSSHDSKHAKERESYYESLRIKKKCLYCNKSFSVPKSIQRVECCSRSCALKYRWKTKGIKSFNRE